MHFSRLFDSFARANGTPPPRLWSFFNWGLRGAWPTITLALFISVLVGLSEVLAAFFVGWAIDLATISGPAALFSDNWGKFLALAVFFIILRPALMGLSSAMGSLAIGTGVFPLIMSRLHRHTIGQSLSFFDDDFAGRIAQKQQQSARAITDVVMETVNAGGFAIASILGASLLVLAIHPLLAGFLCIWVVGYLFLIRWFLPRIRERAKARAAKRAMVTGQIVDTITNMPTVKLFATGEHEDQEALEALSQFKDKAVDFGVMSAWFRYLLMTLAGTLPVMIVGGALWLWSHNMASPGDI